MIEIVILAMIAAFLGLQLYRVLGRRAEHEEEPVPTRFDRARTAEEEPAAQAPASVRSVETEPVADVPPMVEQGVRAIAAADRGFDLSAFLEGAKGAYGMILEAFWKGDRETLSELCDRDVYESFVGAIDAREEAGEKLDNRLIRIEETRVRGAELIGREARISVGFVSDIASVTYDKDGQLVAGSLDDAIESRDVWTFSRDLNSANPDWVLDETDEG